MIILIEAARRGLKIVEVPITYYPREGESKLSSFSDGWRHLKFMLIQTPKHLYYIPGIFMLLFGLSLLIIMNLMPISIGDVTLGVNSIIASLLFVLTGYQLIFLGLFASIYGHKIGYFELDKSSKLLKHILVKKGLAIGSIAFISGVVYNTNN